VADRAFGAAVSILLARRPMRAALVLWLGLSGCQAAGPASQMVPPDGGGGADGGTTTNTALNARMCPDYQMIPGAKLCRTQTDCTTPDTFCRSPSYVFPVPGGGCFGGAAPPPAECRTDLDCQPGYRCTGQRPGCADYYSRCQPGPCTPAAPCSTGQRCRSDGRCEFLSCTDGSWTCPAHLKCSADPMAPGRDPLGCVARPCTEGYACFPDQVCEVGGRGSDAWGCRAKNCSEGVPCPGWQQCQPVPWNGSTTSACVARPCKSDRDCPCGMCLGDQCEAGPGACMGFPSFPP
jgi:hypothetical protein